MRLVGHQLLVHNSIWRRENTFIMEILLEVGQRLRIKIKHKNKVAESHFTVQRILPNLFPMQEKTEMELLNFRCNYIYHHTNY